MGLLERAKKTRILIDRQIEEPYQHVKATRVRYESQNSSHRLMISQKNGIEGSSMTDALLENYEKLGVVDEKYEILMKNAAAQIYGGTSPGLLDLL